MLETAWRHLAVGSVFVDSLDPQWNWNHCHGGMGSFVEPGQMLCIDILKSARCWSSYLLMFFLFLALVFFLLMYTFIYDIYTYIYIHALYLTGSGGYVEFYSRRNFREKNMLPEKKYV